MSAPTSPAILIASAGRSAGTRGLPGRGHADHRDLRVSDADRAAIADQLSAHYGEGRLDQDEFSQRLDQAMGARTHRDLAGLLHDLPQPQEPTVRGGSAPQRRRRSGLGRLLVLAVLAVALLAAIHALTWALSPVLWICVLSAIVLLALRRSRRQ